jgi:hypothetical protein
MAENGGQELNWIAKLRISRYTEVGYGWADLALFLQVIEQRP